MSEPNPMDTAFKTDQVSAPSPPQIPGFEILEELGRGGMGVVYKARHIALDRMVAIKIVSPDGSSVEGLRRFHAETQFLARLEHPNIVQIYNVGEVGGRPFFTLELVNGGNLKQKLSTGLPSPKQAARFVETLARALHVAHAQNILHRDLKPQNILLVGSADLPLHQCTPKIADFGLAKCLGVAGPTRNGVILGTPSYMAPEQAEGHTEEIGPAADVYSLGAILYEVLTGRPPFLAANPLDTILQVMSEEPESPSHLRPGVPTELEAICLKCLRKDQAQRYRSAEALAEDLGRFRSELAPVDRPQPAPARRPLVWLTVAAIAFVGVLATILVSCGLFALIWFSPKAERDPNVDGNPNVAKVQLNKDKDKQLADKAAAEENAVKTIRIVEALIARAEKSRGDKEKNLIDQAALDEAMPQFERAGAVELNDPDVRRMLASNWHRVSLLYGAMGKNDEAAKSVERAIAVSKRLAADFPNESQYRRDLAGQYHRLGFLLKNANRLDEAETASREAIALREKLVTEFPTRHSDRRSLALYCQTLGFTLIQNRRDADSVKPLTQALDLYEKLLIELAPQRSGELDWDKIQNSLLAYYNRSNQNAEVEKLYRRSASLWETLAKKAPKDAKMSRKAGLLYHLLGGALTKAKKAVEAEKAYRQALIHREKLAMDSPEVPENQSAHGASLHNLAMLLMERADAEPARQMLERAVQAQHFALNAEPKNSVFRGFLRNHYWVLAKAQLQLGNHGEAAKNSLLLPTLYPDGWVEYHRAAGLLAQCATIVDQDKKLDASQKQSQTKIYADQAIEELQKGVRRGFNNAVDLKNNLQFQALRGRADFDKLLIDLATEPAGGEARIRYQFGKTMGIGLVLTDDQGQKKPITYSANGETATGDTNLTLLQIDGQTSVFGSTQGAWNPRQVVLGRGADDLVRLGHKSIWIASSQVSVTQSIQVVRSATGKLDTCLIAYLLENKSNQPHKVGLRASIDTMIVDNDANPFVAANRKGLITAAMEFRDAEVPQYLKALQKPDLQNPGFSAYLTLRVEGGVQTPDRAMIHGFVRTMVWETPLQVVANDVVVSLYWNPVELQPGERRIVGYAYGQGVAVWKDGKSAPVP